MNEQEEFAYLAGQRSVYREMMAMALDKLTGHSGIDGAALLLERTETVATLRRLCGEHGSNDWPDDADLSDVIEKCLVLPLRQEHRRDLGRVKDEATRLQAQLDWDFKEDREDLLEEASGKGGRP